jgi:hypothetical protein
MKLINTFIIILFLILLLFIISSIYYNIHIEKYDNNRGAVPTDNGWTNYHTILLDTNSNLVHTSDGPCKYKNPKTGDISFGITDNDKRCYQIDSMGNKVYSQSDLESNRLYHVLNGEEGKEEEESNKNCKINKKMEKELRKMEHVYKECHSEKRNGKGNKLFEYKGDIIKYFYDLMGLNNDMNNSIQNDQSNQSCRYIEPTTNKVYDGYSNDGKTCNIYEGFSMSNHSKEKQYPFAETCWPNQTNFDEKCKKINSNWGVEKIIPCDENHSKIICSTNYINKNHYGENAMITPCLNKSDDFDEWCKYYNSSHIPSGYNVNSIGAKEILEGSKGNCYLSNGQPDTNKARAICDYNHMETINKLDNISNNYNKFTDCLPVKTNFRKICNGLFQNIMPIEEESHINNTDIYAVEIQGYDCNPGYARSKCITKSDYDRFHMENNNSMTEITSVPTNIGNESCQCL